MILFVVETLLVSSHGNLGMKDEMPGDLRMTSTNFFVIGRTNWFFLPLQMILMELVFNWKSVFSL